MESVTSNQLLQAIHQIEARHFDRALEVIKAAKESDPHNIYVLALEKQLTKIVHFTDPVTLTEDEVTEAIDLLQVLVDHALNETRTLKIASPSAPAFQPQPTATVHPKMGREAALAALKTQCFNRADECIIKGDFQGALLEIRRIYILDPENATAREYEQRIDELSTLRSTPTAEVIEEVRTTEHNQEPMTFGEDEPVTLDATTKTFAEEDVLEILPTPEKRPVQTPRRFSLKAVVIGTLLFAVAAGSLYYVTWKKANDERLMARFRESPPSASANQGNEKTTEVAQQVKGNAAETKQPSSQSGSNVPKTQTPGGGSSAQQTGAVTAAKNEQAESTEVGAPAQNLETTDTSPSVQQPEPSRDKRVETISVQSLKPLDQMPLASASAPNEAIQPPSQLPVVQKDPQLVRLEKPRFPEIALKNGIEGEVYVQVQISEQGKPLQAKILKSTNSLLDDAVIEAAMNSVYSPGVMSAGPVTTWVTIPFRFKR